ncbi:MAG: PIN domain-containing protein [Deltaproteobacteria bacterium]|nr:PIN domain-containing protein [Deltaproteobacteria bacterium]
MKDKVLVDTSIWIEFFKKKEAPIREGLIQLLERGAACYIGIIALELYRGAKTEREVAVLDDLFMSIENVTEGNETHKEAGLMGRVLAQQGITVGAVDLLIARLALENALSLFSLDNHFDAIAQWFPLKRYQV